MKSTCTQSFKNNTSYESLSTDFDQHQEIARAAFSDMLHDTERNQKYYKGIKIAIDEMHDAGHKAIVLDIGTGTGILSMMAVRCGADIVYACEAFRPMANCAKTIIVDNGMENNIVLIKKRSTDIKVGKDGGDMQCRANILVTEVFDTELIGEGAIGIFNHAHAFLLEANCIVVPHSATMYAQLVESPFIWAWNMPKTLPNLEGEIMINTPKLVNCFFYCILKKPYFYLLLFKILNCKGSPALHDIQLSQLSMDKFKSIAEPMPVFSFDWSGKSKISIKNGSSQCVKANQAGSPHAVFMWWDIKFDRNNEILLSCAPFWSHPELNNYKQTSNEKQPQNSIPWRDHWMQAIYFLQCHQNFHLNENEMFYLNFYHDEYSLWFDVTKHKQEIIYDSIRQPLCECGFHNAYSRTRIGQMNDSVRNKKYLKLLEQTIQSDSIVLCISDGSLLGLVSRVLGAKKVYCLESHCYSHQVMKTFIETNQLENVHLIKNINELLNLNEITHVIAEPNFISSILPFDNFYFGKLLKQIKNQLRSDIIILPQIGIVKAVPVEFLNLHKISSPLGICEDEFDLTSFDHFIQVQIN